MEWQVDFYEDFRPEFLGLPEPVRVEIFALIEVLKRTGPYLKRPGSDTLSGSKHANMKELRFDANDGVWRVAYAFDTQRMAMLLVAGDKSGVSQRRFYETLIKKADDRFAKHLAAINLKVRKK